MSMADMREELLGYVGRKGSAAFCCAAVACGLLLACYFWTPARIPSELEAERRLGGDYWLRGGRVHAVEDAAGVPCGI